MFRSEPKAVGLRVNAVSLPPSIFEPLEVRTLFANPSVADVTPFDKAGNVPIDTFIACNVNLVSVGDGVDPDTVSKAGAVTLVRNSDGLVIPGQANTTGGGDAIVFTPSQPLDLNTKYKFTVTAQVKDDGGRSFTPFTSTFTTSTTPPTAPPKDIRFQQIPLTNATGKEFTSVAVGPDHRLYIADLTGYIIRYDILDDGTLGQSKTITTVRDANNNPRLITGLLFAGSKTNPDVYVSHGFSSVLGSPNHTGKISKLTGANLDTYKDLVTNLPRSFKDHLTNQMAFGPDGAIYISQGSQTAMGAPDAAWGQRSEHLLSATILRLDLSKLGSSTLNARTSDAGGSYNPFASDAPLTIYATGIRNAYDLQWTSDGRLFTSTNGSASGGNTPEADGGPYTGKRIDEGTNGPYTGPNVPGLSGVSSQPDFLYDVKKNGYYGHPNPLRDEYVLNGGNPTSGTDPGEVKEYPVGTQPDRNYKGFAWNFGQHTSSNGFVEYKSNTFNGKLKGALLVTQYSGGDNIVMLKRSGGTINDDTQNIVGFTGFVDPLDIAEDTTNGYLYVAEFGGKRITLLRPDSSSLASGSKVATDQSTMYFADLKGGARSPSQVLIIKNSGDQPLTINQLTLTGEEPGLFEIVQKPPLPAKLQPGANISIKVAFKPGTSAAQGIHTATLRIKSVDTNSGNAKSDFNVALRGFAQNRYEGAGEPSLQQIMDLHQINIEVGDSDPNTPVLPLPTQTPNDEVTAQTFTRADHTKLVTIEPIASFSPNGDPIVDFGYYSAVAGDKQPLFSVLDSSYQQVDVKVTGTQEFSPGKNPFGLYLFSPHYKRTAYTQDQKNKWSIGKTANGHVIRSYPLKDANGAAVANAYVVAVEFASSDPDQQEAVFIIRNVVANTKAVTDKTPPAPPTNLRVLGTAGAISLDWDESVSDDTAGYIVKRSTNSKTDFIQIGGLVTDSAFADDTGGLKKYYYRIFAQDLSGNLSDPAKTSATKTATTSTPSSNAPLASQDIGNPSPKGSTNFLVSGSAYDVIAGGSDIQGTSDQFRFAHKTIKGDFDVKVRVNSLTATDVWAKAGIMVRKTLDANARNIFMLTSPTKHRLTYRVDGGGNTTAVGAGVPSFPNNWLRLQRVGNVYTGYTSTNGTTWTKVASVTMNLGTTLYVGLAATSHNTSQTTTAQFRDLTL